MSAIYDYYNAHRILTDQPPRDFVFNKKTTFLKLIYEDYEGSKVPIDTKKAIGTTTKPKPHHCECEWLFSRCPMKSCSP